MRWKARLQILSGLALFALAAVSADRIISIGPAEGLSSTGMALRYAGVLALAAAGGLMIQMGLKSGA